MTDKLLPLSRKELDEIDARKHILYDEMQNLIKQSRTFLDLQEEADRLRHQLEARNLSVYLLDKQIKNLEEAVLESKSALETIEDLANGQEICSATKLFNLTLNITSKALTRLSAINLGEKETN